MRQDWDVALMAVEAPTELRAAARSALSDWLAQAPEDHVEAIGTMLSSGAADEVVDAFRRTLPFGTGGRRGRVGLGPNRINDQTIAASAQGHADFLRANYDGPLSVVIAWDVRRFEDTRGVLAEGTHPLRGRTSEDFGRIAAAVYVTAGIEVHMLPPGAGRVMSTPELSHAIRTLGATGGLMVSASHNPPDDNGAKVYDHLGGQLVPPVDQAVLTAVAAVDEVKTTSWERAQQSGRIQWIGEDVRDAYVDTVLSASRRAGRGLRVAFSPLHGAGLYSVLPVLEKAGFDVVAVEPQCSADGLFPTVPFSAPNPEVPSALELGIAYADEAGADLLLATDPDADRIGAVVRHGERWVRLDGNAIAALVVDHALAGDETGLVVRTEVTTSLVSRIAEAHGAPLRDDLLVGFKYIGALLAGYDGPFAAGVEESHGVLVTADMRDKDAAGGALYLCEAAAELASEGRTLVDRLDELFEQHGQHHNRLASLVMEGASGQARIAAMLEAFRSATPDSIAGRRVLRMRDRQSEADVLGPVRCDTDRASRNMLVFELEGARVILRPSGTEPKVKIYTEVVGGEASQALELERALVGEGLRRVGVELPRWALAVSSLVSVEWRLRFVQEILPMLESTDGDVMAAADAALAPLGRGARTLFADAVAAWAMDKPERQAIAQAFR